jgi:hypothetical protein
VGASGVKTLKGEREKSFSARLYCFGNIGLSGRGGANLLPPNQIQTTIRSCKTLYSTAFTVQLRALI